MEIQSRYGSYRVEQHADVESALRGGAPDKRWLVVDAWLAANALWPFDDARRAGRLVVVQGTEAAKTYGAVGDVLEGLLDAGFRRDCELVAVGGGVVQDVAGFCATVLMRGVRWSYLPSTLLAQADSCIGAKSSINIGHHKNQLGSFYPPERVCIVSSLLGTLTPDQVRSGLGEVVKFHLLEGEVPWRRIRAELDDRTPAHLAALAWRSLAIKKRYIEEDEFDRGVRNLLNYGHTFGHAFESATSFAIPHGIAVSLGIGAATYVSERRGLCDAAHLREVLDTLRPLFHPYETHLPGTTDAALLRALRADKKNTAGATYCILTRGPGRMEKVAVDLPGEILPALRDYFAMLATG